MKKPAENRTTTPTGLEPELDQLEQLKNRDSGVNSRAKMLARRLVPWVVDGHMTYIRERKVRCGKGCASCPHALYLYQCWRGSDGKRHELYIGKWNPKGHGFIEPGPGFTEKAKASR